MKTHRHIAALILLLLTQLAIPVMSIADTRPEISHHTAEQTTAAQRCSDCKQDAHCHTANTPAYANPQAAPHDCPNDDCNCSGSCSSPSLPSNVQGPLGHRLATDINNTSRPHEQLLSRRLLRPPIST
ncbi:hypothetical protein [Spongiibacter sp.]|uniref:hypothetical protein n=1 Tax=Spongiibacter sp. TaxID=2024860 RepID=UPI0035680780